MDYKLLLPDIILISLALGTLTFDLLLPREWKYCLGYLGLMGLVLALVSSLTLLGQNGVFFNGMFVLDSFSIFFKVVLSLIGILIILSSLDFFRKNPYEGEYYSLLIFSILGAMMMAAAVDLVAIYLALELASIPAYVLTGYRRRDVKSSEAALKYFLLGLLASVVMVYGMSLVYGLTGHTNLLKIASQLLEIQPALILAMLFIATGLSLKIAAIPFHFWAPDAYEGAPTPVTAFLSAGPKSGAFALLIRIFFIAFVIARAKWMILFAILSAFTMTLGNLMALSQRNIKRMLAYSSIAHSGYMLIGLAVGSTLSVSSIFLYILVYVLANVGAFAVVIGQSRRGRGELIQDYAGLSQSSPFLAFSLTIFFLSLVGIPPLAGFVGKLYLFGAAVQKGFVWLAVLGVINSVVSLYYYLAVVRQMYLLPPTEETKIRIPASLASSISIALIFVLAVGIYPSPFIRLAQLASLL